MKVTSVVPLSADIHLLSTPPRLEDQRAETRIAAIGTTADLDETCWGMAKEEVDVSGHQQVP